MKKVIVLCVIGLALCTPLFSLAANDSKEASTESTTTVAALFQPDEGRSGCCSWHGGVCGCQGGRTLCCDGTLSPSCKCD